MDGAEALLIAALRGEAGVSRELVEPGRQGAFIDAATRHRVRPLLAWLLRGRRELPEWPDAIRESLLASARAEAAIEVYRRAELVRLLRAFDAGGIPVLLLKGAALAYSLYPEPWLRPRQDTDLLIRRGDVENAAIVLERAGYAAIRAVSGALVSQQRNYVRAGGQGLRHDIDLHWKAFNPLPIADLFPPEELLEAAEVIQLGDGGHARVARRDHAFILACLHRAGHHPGGRDLIWLYDVHLMAGRLAGDEAVALVRTARRTGTGAVCAQALRLAAGIFDPRGPSPRLLTELESPGQADGRVPAIYLGNRVRKTDLLRADLAAIPTWRGRMRLIREHLFPPADYMLTGGAGRSRFWLPALYLRRILQGAAGWFRPL